MQATRCRGSMQCHGEPRNAVQCHANAVACVQRCGATQQPYEPVVCLVDIVSCDIQQDDLVSSLKDRLQELLKEKLQMGPQDVRVQAQYEQDGQMVAADARLRADTFQARQGQLVVRGTSLSAALRLSGVEGLETLDKALNSLREATEPKLNNLALRKLVDLARQKIWKDSTSDLDAVQLKAFLETNRQAGQSEQAWGLRLKALDSLKQGWRDSINKDVLAVATDSPFYNKVLCPSAHEYTCEEQQYAVGCLDGELEPMYQLVYKFVHTSDMTLKMQ